VRRIGTIGIGASQHTNLYPILFGFQIEKDKFGGTCPLYFSKHNVSETGFCLRLQVKPIQLGPIDRAIP
jgi:hypothetical protein